MRMYPSRLLAIATLLFVVAIAQAAANFFRPQYLQDVHGWTSRAVGLMTFGAGSFAIQGNTIAGWLSDSVGRRQVTVSFRVRHVIFPLLITMCPLSL